MRVLLHIPDSIGVFAELVDVLGPLGVQLPSQLLHSPYLTLQREQRKRRQASQGRGGKKRDTRNLYERLASIITKEWLLLSWTCRQ